MEHKAHAFGHNPPFPHVLCSQKKTEKSPDSQQFIAAVILYRDDSSSSGIVYGSPLRNLRDAKAATVKQPKTR